MAERMPDKYRSDSSPWTFVIVVLLVLAAGVGIWWYMAEHEQALPSPFAGGPQPDAAQPAPAAPAAPAPPVATGPQNLVEPIAPPDGALPPLAQSDERAQSALDELFGRRSVAQLLNVDGFVRRFVATVDNLPRREAPSRVWPVQPTAEHFGTRRAAQVETIGPDNAARYTPFVQLVEKADIKKTVGWYARAYPLFQQAYEELGYPGKYFNDRFVAVLDHLIAAPEPEEPVQVVLTKVNVAGGGGAPDRPWVRYEFADPQLESLSSGQKLMVRMGLANERRLKTRLRALREEVATGVAQKN